MVVTDKIVMVEMSYLSFSEKRLMAILFWGQAKIQAANRLKAQMRNLRLAQNGQLIATPQEVEKDINETSELIVFISSRHAIAKRRWLQTQSISMF